METKACSVCKQELPFPEGFYSNGSKRGKASYSAACKDCTKQRARVAYLEKKDKYKSTRHKYRVETRDTRLARANQRVQKIKNHKDPDLIPYREWRDTILGLKDQRGLSWKEIIRITGISNIQNQTRGHSWPPDIDDARRAIAALREASDKRVDLDKWLQACAEVQKKFGLSQSELERKMWVWPGLITRQKRGDKPPPTKMDAERYLRRAYGLAVQMTEAERKRMKTTVIYLPGGENYVKLEH